MAGLYNGITLAERNVILLVDDSVSNLARAEFSVRFKLALFYYFYSENEIASI